MYNIKSIISNTNRIRIGLDVELNSFNISYARFSGSSINKLSGDSTSYAAINK
jgi:hypothetical protein